MKSRLWFSALIAAVGVERVAELVVSRRNLQRSLKEGGHEVGAGHYPAMVLLHTGLLVGSLAEVWRIRRPFHPSGWVALTVVFASQGLRWWCISALGRQWNTRIVVVPGAARVRRGPYRYLTHPNYLAVVAEGAALPLVHDARYTAAGFSVANAVLLQHRIRAEDAALTRLDHA